MKNQAIPPTRVVRLNKGAQAVFNAYGQLSIPPYFLVPASPEQIRHGGLQRVPGTNFYQS
jgi:hypothetical protein